MELQPVNSIDTNLTILADEVCGLRPIPAMPVVYTLPRVATGCEATFHVLVLFWSMATHRDRNEENIFTLSGSSDRS